MFILNYPCDCVRIADNHNTGSSTLQKPGAHIIPPFHAKEILQMWHSSWRNHTNTNNYIILYTIQACPTGGRRIGFIIRCISVSAVYYMKYVRTLQQEDNIKHEKNRLYVLGLLSSIIYCELYCSTPFILCIIQKSFLQI